MVTVIQMFEIIVLTNYTDKTYLLANVDYCEAQPDLSGNPFLLVLRVLLKLKSSCKKDWEWKAEIAAQIF